jgi:hypothetical protein
MEVSALTLRVLLLFFPGVLCAMLVDALTVHRERTAAEFLTHSFVLGLTSHLLLYTGQWTCEGVAEVLGLPPPLPVTFFNALLNDTLRIAWGEIVLTAGIAAMLGLLVSGGINNQVLHRGARHLRITRKRGSLDVWSYVLGSSDVNWIIARDLQHGFTYFGWLEEFSETAEIAELWLRDVAVYESSSGTKLYESDGLYFSRDPRSLVIEIVPADQHSGAADGREAVRADEREHAGQDGAESQSKNSAAGLRSRPAKAAARNQRRRRREQRA